MNEIYLVVLTSLSTVIGVNTVNYFKKRRQKWLFEQWESDDKHEVKKNFIKTMTGFDDIINSEHYSKEIKLLVTRMKSIFESNFEQINKDCSSWGPEYNCGHRHSVNYYFEYMASCLSGNIEEIFLEYTINLTPREKDILDDLVKVRSIYLSHSEKEWLHKKCKEIYEEK